MMAVSLNGVSVNITHLHLKNKLFEAIIYTIIKVIDQFCLICIQITFHIPNYYSVPSMCFSF
jgi:hypothetical protein